MTTIFFVRHAVTSHTGKRLSGWMEGVGLTDEGRGQAERVGERLAEVPFKAIYSSPIERTVETARAIASHHDVPVQTTRKLGEVDYGKWTNRPLKMLARTKLWSRVQRWPSAIRFPEGETLREVQARAIDEIERIALDHPKEVVCVVSHADVIKLVVAHYLGVHVDLFQRIVIGPASVSVVNLGESGPMVVSVNASGEALLEKP